MDAGSLRADFSGEIDALRIVLSHIGQKFAVEGGLLPSLRPPQIVIQLRQPVVIRNSIHFLVGLKHFKHLIKAGVDFVPVDFDELAEPDILRRHVSVDLDGGYDRVDHIEDGGAVAVLGEGLREVGVMPYFQLVLAVYGQHGRSHEEEAVLDVELSVAA